MNAFPLTAPVSWRGTVVCNDDCDNCPLFQNGCAGGGVNSKGENKGCNRWDNLVCKDCPCLASSYADLYREPILIDPALSVEEAKEFVDSKQRIQADPKLFQMRLKRKLLDDGEPIEWNS